MNAKLLIAGLSFAAVAALAGLGLYRLGLERGMQSASALGAERDAKAPDARVQANEKRILYWHDPMVPGPRFDKPGKSPFMDMDLVPVYADAAGDEGGVAISPRVQQNLGVRTAEVTRGALATSFEAVGSVAYNERDVAVVPARSNGFLERLYVRAPLDRVRQGQPLAELYVPDWVAAQEEFLSAKRISAQSEGNGLATIVDGARQRMRLAGMSDAQIQRVESTGELQSRATLFAPIGGVVAELTAREGMTVTAGAPLFRLNGLSTVWVNAEVPEALAAQMRSGNAVEARVSAIPNVVFEGRVGAILPEVNPATRTIKARIELANPSGQLVPGMFVTVNFGPSAQRDLLLVPSEAVIRTGKRNVVIVAEGDGKFKSVEVDVGHEDRGQSEIRKGLQAGQRVVVSGQFLVDSEASLRASATRMSEPAAGASPDPPGAKR